jgi:hypothetical protein
MAHATNTPSTRRPHVTEPHSPSWLRFGVLSGMDESLDLSHGPLPLLCSQALHLSQIADYPHRLSTGESLSYTWGQLVKSCQVLGGLQISAI